MQQTDTVVCPYCGESIPRKASACPHCGSDERTGWSEKTYLNGIDLGEEVDYEEIRRKEFEPGRFSRFSRLQIIAALLLLLLFVAAFLRQYF